MKLAIKVHGNVELSKAVQAVLFQHGYKWDWTPVNDKPDVDCVLIGSEYIPSQSLSWSLGSSYPAENDFPIFDAATEPLSKLVELLTKPKQIKFKSEPNGVEITVCQNGTIFYEGELLSKETVDRIIFERETLMKGGIKL